jgi:REP element-mobilizing transposase RayT
MTYNPLIHNRKSIRLKEYDYSQTGEYFITICTYNRKNIFGDIIHEEMQLSQMGTIVQRYWKDIPDHFQNVELDDYIIMPNHIHGIIILNNPVGAIHESPLPMNQLQRRKMTLSKIIGRFKMITAKEINILYNTVGSHVWQRNYYEHIIHNDKELNNIRDYITDNPLKWHLDEENPNNICN